MLTSPNAINQSDPVTVSDLIQMLSCYPPDQVICIPGYEGGFDQISGIKKQVLLKNVNKEWYYGRHDSLGSVCDQDSYEKEEFLIITK